MGIKGFLRWAMGLCLLVHSITIEATTLKCSDLIAGLDGHLLWMQDLQMGTVASDKDSKIIVVADGSEIKGLRQEDGKAIWTLRVEDYFSLAQYPIIRRDGNRVYLVGVKQIIELDAVSGETTQTIDTPFMMVHVEHDIRMGIMFPRRFSRDDAQVKIYAKEALEQQATDRSLYILDEWLVIRDQEGIRFRHKDGGPWEFKAMPGFFAAQSIMLEPPIFEDKDQLVTWAYTGPSKNARIEVYGFNKDKNNFDRRWSLELRDPLERPTDFVSTDKIIYLSLIVPTSKDDGIKAKRFLAIDRKTGEILWSKLSNSRSWQDHSLLASEKFFISAVDDQVIARNAETGEKLWDFEISVDPQNTGQIKIQWLNQTQVLAIRGKKAFILKAQNGRLEADIALYPVEGAVFDPRITVLDPQNLIISSMGGGKDKLGLVRLK